MAPPKKQDPDFDPNEVYNQIYLLRYPFSITAINWGAGLGMLLGAHTFVRTRNFPRSIFTGMASGFFVGFAMFGYLYLKNLAINDSIKSYERNQIQLIAQEQQTRELLQKTLAPDNPDISNDELFERKKYIEQTWSQKNILLSKIIEPRDFGF